METFPKGSRSEESLHAKEERLATRLLEKAERILKRVTQAGMILSLAGTLNYLSTKHSTTEKVEADGEITFEHDDPETTANLNYLTGKGEIPEAEKIRWHREFVRLVASSNSYTISDDLSSMNEKQLIEVLSKIRSGPAGDARGDVIDGIAWSVPQFEYNEKFHTAIWRLLTKVGSPKVRLIGENETLPDKIMGASANRGGYYNALTNTIYIKASFGRESLIAETAHADQFRNKPIESSMRGAYSAVSVAMSSAVNFRSISDSYAAEYSRSGSIEHEAHQILEPKFKQEVMDSVYNNEDSQAL